MSNPEILDEAMTPSYHFSDIRPNEEDPVRPETFDELDTAIAGIYSQLGISPNEEGLFARSFGLYYGNPDIGVARHVNKQGRVKLDISLTLKDTMVKKLTLRNDAGTARNRRALAGRIEIQDEDGSVIGENVSAAEEHVREFAVELNSRGTGNFERSRVPLNL